jgi:hypothetical protein
MDTVIKTFVVPTDWLRRRLPNLWESVQKINAKKYGRLRRGMVMLSGLDAKMREDGTAEVRVLLSRRPKSLEVPVEENFKVRMRRFCLYDHGNVGKVMKELTVAASKVT